MAASNLARWGVDDCITYLLPAGAVRPAWLTACCTDEDAVREAVRKFGSLQRAYECTAKEYGMDEIGPAKMIRPLALARPGDRVVGRDRNRGVVAAVVAGDHACYIRTRSGTMKADWVTVYSVWRVGT